MSDVKVTISSQGADSAIRDLGKIKNASDRVNASMRQGAGSKQKNTGLAFLEFSRGVEDFQAAGLRGVLNNIPQMLMFAGAGPQVAGAISLIAVASAVAGPLLVKFALGLEKMAKAGDRADEIRDRLASLTDTIFKLDMSQSTKDAEANIRSQMDSLEDSISAPREQFQKLRKDIEETAESATAIQNLRSRLADINGNSEGAAMRASANEVLNLEREITKQKEIQAANAKAIADLNSAEGGAFLDAPQMSPDFMDFDDYKSRVVALTTALDALEKKNEQLTNNVGKSTQELGFNLTSVLNQLQDALGGDDFFTQRQLTALRNQSNERDAVKELIQNTKQELATLEQKKSLQDQSVAAYDKAIAKIREERDALNESDEATRRKLNALEAQLVLQKQIAEATKKQADKEFEDKMSKYFMDTAPDASNFLSSRGAVGLGAREAQTSLSVISLQKQANKHLAEIARNTRNAGSSTYN